MGGMKMAIKRMAACVTVVLMLILCSCASLSYQTKQFDSLEDLMAAIGSGYVYPVKLPEGFTPDEYTFTGYRYTQTDTWEYLVSYSNSAVHGDVDDYSIEPGRIEIGYISVRCYEPEHPLPRPRNRVDWMNSFQSRVNDFGRLFFSDDPEYLLGDEDMEAIYKSQYPGVTSGQVPLLYMHCEAQLFSGFILYDISIRYYTNEDGDDEDFMEYGRELAEFMVVSSLG